MTTLATALVTQAPAPLSIHTVTPLVAAGHAADSAAARAVFRDYRERRAAATLRAHDVDLASFAANLAACQMPPPLDWLEPPAWHGISWGLVAGFVRYLVAEGHAVASVNRALSTIKTYARLGMQAGALDPREVALIRSVAGYRHAEGRRVDAARAQTRRGHKKAAPTSMAPVQARQLKNQPDTPQGRRDALLMCLLLDHGLRVGEVAILTVEGFDTEAGTFTFYRPKVDKTQTHRMTADTLRAALAYLRQDAPTEGPLLRGSRKSGRLEGAMSVRAINARVGELGRAIGLDDLSPHDARHFWATQAIRSGTVIKSLQDAGG